MRRVLLLCAFICSNAQASVKDEKDLLQGIEQTTGDPLLTVAITRDPFSWPLHHLVRKVAHRKIATPLLAWSVTGISATKRGLYALLDDGKDTKLARTDDELGNGWKIASISQQGVLCKHVTGCAQELRV